MSFELLLPLGLLGLLGIVALIIIYIIRPNYQTKHITSTYVWKLSLRYRKKRPPTSRLRNILIFICQLLILTAMAGIMAWPALVERTETNESEVVYILDSSASMYAETDGTTRFECALEEIRSRAGVVIDAGGTVSVIVADDAPYYLVKQTDINHKMQFNSDLDGLAERGCSYSVSDIEGALSLSREILTANSAATVYLFTDTKYPLTSIPYFDRERTMPKVHVEVVRDNTVRPLAQADGEEEEWNAAILDASTSLENGYYTVTVQVACYGMSLDIPVSVNVEGANSIPDSEDESTVLGKTISYEEYAHCQDGKTATVVFRVGGGTNDENFTYYPVRDDEKFFSYRSIVIRLDSVDDSLTVDNSYSIYGGQKQRLKVEYFSNDPNPFINAALGIAHNALASRYELEITEIKKGDEPILEGFDFYIFEHQMPETLPTDGAILLFDPCPRYGAVPAEAGFQVETMDAFDSLFPLAEGDDYEGHPVARNLLTGDPESGGIAVTLYDIVSYYDPAFQILLTCDGNPALMVRNEEETKIAVVNFSVNWSNLAKLPENFLFMYNLLDWFFPSIAEKNAVEVKEEFTLNTWGDELVLGNGEKVFKAEELPAAYSVDVPGTYTFHQTTYYNKAISFSVFAKPPASESNIRPMADSLGDPYEGTEEETYIRDLLIILASVLVALLFVEWWLQSRDNK